MNEKTKPNTPAAKPAALLYTMRKSNLTRDCDLPFSALRPNEIENLSRFEDAGGTALLACIAIFAAAALLAWAVER